MHDTLWLLDTYCGRQIDDDLELVRSEALSFSEIHKRTGYDVFGEENHSSSDKDYPNVAHGCGGFITYKLRLPIENDMLWELDTYSGRPVDDDLELVRSDTLTFREIQKRTAYDVFGNEDLSSSDKDYPKVAHGCGGFITYKLRRTTTDS